MSSGDLVESVRPRVRVAGGGGSVVSAGGEELSRLGENQVLRRRSASVLDIPGTPLLYPDLRQDSPFSQAIENDRERKLFNKEVEKDEPYTQEVKMEEAFNQEMEEAKLPPSPLPPDLKGKRKMRGFSCNFLCCIGIFQIYKNSFQWIFTS